MVPEIPTIAESGYPGHDANTWIGFAVPAGTPRPIIDKLSGEIARIMRSPDVSERYRSEAAEVVGSTPEQLAAFLAADTARWAAVIKSGNVKPD